MLTQRCRRFTVLDALFLIAAGAVGLAWMRFFQEGESGGESYPDTTDMYGRARWGFAYGLELVNWWVTSLAYCAATVTVGLLALRLRGQTKTGLRRLTRRPGAVAVGAVLLTVAADLLTAASEILCGVLIDKSYVSVFQFSYLSVSGPHAGVAVATAWGLLALSGRWRREPGWLDTSGIALGVFWLSQAVLSWTVDQYRPYF